MRIFFTILLFLFANNLFAQYDTLEVNRIDSFIENNKSIRNKEFTATESFPNLECLDCKKRKEVDDKTVLYKFINKERLFKISMIWHYQNDTSQITNYYFESKKLIKVETFIPNEFDKLQLAHIVYYKANEFLYYKSGGGLSFSNKVHNERVDSYLRRAKKIIKKAKTKSWKFTDF